jgi:uncharacterized protein (DUF58 family)
VSDDPPRLLRAPLLAATLALLLLGSGAVVGVAAAWPADPAPAGPCWMPEDAR